MAILEMGDRQRANCGRPKRIELLLANHRRSESRSAGTIFQGSQSVWRTQDWAGTKRFSKPTALSLQRPGADPACGNFVQIGPSWRHGSDSSVATTGGTTRAGGLCAAVARATSDTSDTMGSDEDGTSVHFEERRHCGRLSVTYTRLDTLPSAKLIPVAS